MLGQRYRGKSTGREVGWVNHRDLSGFTLLPASFLVGCGPVVLSQRLISDTERKASSRQMKRCAQMFRMWRSKDIFVLTCVKSWGYLFSESLKFKAAAQRISFYPENNNNKIWNKTCSGWRNCFKCLFINDAQTWVSEESVLQFNTDSRWFFCAHCSCMWRVIGHFSSFQISRLRALFFNFFFWNEPINACIMISYTLKKVEKDY